MTIAQKQRLSLIRSIFAAKAQEDLDLDAIEDESSQDSGKCPGYSDEVTAPCNFDSVGAI